MYCNNCCSTTHLFKNCPEPITSYGLICFHIEMKSGLNKKEIKKYVNENIKYLMIRKRHSFAYIEFMRAKYDLLEPEYIQKLFNYMTVEERILIQNNKFNYLWNKLWLIEKNGMTNPKNKSDFYKGIIKFNILQNGYNCSEDNKFYSTEIFANNANKNYRFPEWYFPKGRKNPNESNINTAKREFIEETNFKYKSFEIIHELDSTEEIHIGSNDVNYKTIFYPAKYNKNLTDCNLKNRNKHQRQEVGDIKWLSINEVSHMFRDYEIEKKKMIQLTHSKIIKYLINNLK
jgi:8-oxo-dGTP pyrophosphatase MutT (NUDIX family)